MQYHIKDDDTEVLVSVSERITTIRVENEDLNPYELELNSTYLDDIAAAVENALKENR